MANQNRDFVIFHFRKALSGALAEANGEEVLSRRLNAQTKLRLITMSDEELQELSQLASYHSDRPADIVYRELKDKTRELKQTADEWLKDLQ